MIKRSACLAVLFCLFASCAAVSAPQNPQINSTTPASALAGSAGFTLRVLGLNFKSGAKVLWNGTALSSTLVSSTEVDGIVPASYLASATTVTIQVTQTVGHVVYVSSGQNFSILSPPSPITLTISPTSVWLPAGGSAQFSTTVTGTTNTAVKWATDAGTISATGLLSATTVAGAYSVTATSVADPSKTARASITVSPVTVTVSPNTGSLQTGATMQFTASVANAVNTAVTWTATGGTVTSGGVYTAPQLPGSYTIIATSVAQPGVSGSATVSVTTPTPPPTATLSANPSSIQAGQSATLTWTTSNATSISLDNGIGSVASSGTLPVSPAATTTYNLSASGAGGSTSANVTVSVTPVVPAGVHFVQANFAPASLQSANSSVAVPYLQPQANGNFNFVVVGWGDLTSQITSVVDTQNNAYKLVALVINSAGSLQQALYYAKNIVGGSNTVTVNFNQVASYPDVRIAEYAGADPVNPLDVFAGAIGNGSLADSGALTTTSPNELLFASGTTGTGFSAAGAGFTSRGINVFGNLIEDRTVNSTGSYNATAPTSAAQWIMQIVTLRASGQAIPPPTVNFTANPSNVALGQSSTLTWTTTNATSVSVDQGIGTVALNGTRTVAPTTSTTYTITATGSGGTQTATATVAVVVPVQHTVNLTWNASTSSGVTGYNIYRGTSSGGPYVKISSAPSVSYVDGSVGSGSTYYYVVTAVAPACVQGQSTPCGESPYSNEAKAAVPLP